MCSGVVVWYVANAIVIFYILLQVSKSSFLMSSSVREFMLSIISDVYRKNYEISKIKLFNVQYRIFVVLWYIVNPHVQSNVNLM